MKSPSVDQIARYSWLIVIGWLISGCSSAAEPAAPSPAPPFDWRRDWAIEAGFALEIDSEGYEFPTAIAFVPEPGPDPKDPLYFVTELAGTIKVVTNDRTSYIFAEKFFNLNPQGALPSGQGQVGLAGICLAPQYGYVFVTFPYHDEQGILRNNVVRFETEPQTFALQPRGQIDFSEVFSPYESGLAHHTGPCQVSDELLYLSVGEAWQPHLTQDLNTMNGKIIRMTLNGRPVPDNPFYEDEALDKAVNFVWAYGLRNPFGLKVMGERVFVADNGVQVDRFLEAQQGENYLWNGNDRTIAANADYVFAPGRAPVQMDYVPAQAPFFPEPYRENFFISLYAFRPEEEIRPGIIRLDYSLAERRVRSMPVDFVRYLGNAYQAVTGLAVGPDGLYFAALIPNEEGRTFVFKVTHRPDQAHPYTMVQTERPAALFVEKGCAGCHRVGDRWGYGGAAGPPLDREDLIERLQTRLNDDAYLASLAEIDQLDMEPYVSYKAARRAVAAAEGMARVRAWVKYRIQEPRFDNQYAAMPNLGVTEAEAAILADFLLNDKEDQQAPGLRGLLPRRLRLRHLAFSFGAGFIAASGLWVGGMWVKAFLSRRNRRKG